MLMVARIILQHLFYSIFCEQFCEREDDLEAFARQDTA